MEKIIVNVLGAQEFPNRDGRKTIRISTAEEFAGFHIDKTTSKKVLGTTSILSSYMIAPQFALQNMGSTKLIEYFTQATAAYPREFGADADYDWAAITKEAFAILDGAQLIVNLTLETAGTIVDDNGAKVKLAEDRIVTRLAGVIPSTAFLSKAFDAINAERYDKQRKEALEAAAVLGKDEYVAFKAEWEKERDAFVKDLRAALTRTAQAMIAGSEPIVEASAEAKAEAETEAEAPEDSKAAKTK